MGCANEEPTIDFKGSYDINLTILGGCWNTDLVCIDHGITFELRANHPDIRILAYNNVTKTWVETNSITNGSNVSDEEIYEFFLPGAITEQIKFKVKDLPLEVLKTLKLEIFASKSEKNPFKVSIGHFPGIAQNLVTDNTHRAVRFWHDVPLQSAASLMDLVDDVRENYISCKVPYLYSDPNNLGFLNLECEVNGYEEIKEEKVVDADRVNKFLEKGFDAQKITNPSQRIKFYIDDIEIVRMIVRNRLSWITFNKFLTADVFKSACEIYLSKNWRHLLTACVEVLESINQEILSNKKPGNWPSVQAECQDIVTKLLNYIPVTDDKDVYDILKNDLKVREDISSDYISPYAKIVKNELKVFSSHDAFFNLVTKVWREATANIWPFKYWVSPTTLWRSSLFFFVIFLILLTHHIYGVDQRTHIRFYESLDDAIGGDVFDKIEDFASFTDWFRNILIPALYDPSDNHLYMLTDKILVRLIRVDPRPCINPKGVPYINKEVPLCYPRLTTTIGDGWNPKSENNFTANFIGKPLLFTEAAFYDSRGDFLILPRNETDADNELNQIDWDNWLDWSVQAVIIEFAMYSPNTQLFSMCAIVGEFSNVGTFQGDHECTIISPLELAHSFSWTAILLYIFFIGFFFEEMWELLMYVLEARPVTSSEEKDALEHCTWCALRPGESCFCKICHNDYPKDGPKACCCAVACYTYVLDIWNVLDIIMIGTGITGLALHNLAASSIEFFTIEELWHIAFIDQLSNVFLSTCVVIAFFRFLDFLIHWEYIGVLVLTVFYMMSAIVKFVILFTFISTGFSAAFHMLYDNNPIYSNFVLATLTTSIGIFSGYEIPDLSNLLFFPNPAAGYAFQVACIVIGVVMLLNFLIAMMNSIYNGIQENSTQEYRWEMTRLITQLKYSPWPVPLNLVQGIIGCGIFCSLCCVDWDLDNELPPDTRNLEERKKSLYSNMIIGYFRETLSEQEYKDALLFDNLHSEKENEEADQ